MVDEFSDTVVVVTGASSGIGAATVQQFSAAGATVVAAARRRDRLETLREECAGRVDPVETDVSEAASVDALVEAAVERHDRLDIVVANAGVAEAQNHRVDTLPRDHYDQVIATNVHGVYNTTRAVIDHLRASDGTLVYTGSSRSQYPSTTTPVYAGSKWWLRGFARSIAGQEPAVSVSVVNPSAVRTEFGQDLQDEAYHDRFEDQEALAPATVAEAILFAARDHGIGVPAEINLFDTGFYEQF